jgi:DNA-directed RNA polymerase sigma subunit (sigma70/sigma32)
VTHAKTPRRKGMRKLKWADEKEARKARAEAILFLRDGGYSLAQVGRAMKLTKEEVRQREAKARRKQPKCDCPSHWRGLGHIPSCPCYVPL